MGELTEALGRMKKGLSKSRKEGRLRGSIKERHCTLDRRTRRKQKE